MCERIRITVTTSALFLGTAAAAYSQGSMTQDLGKKAPGISQTDRPGPIAARQQLAATAHSVPARPRSATGLAKISASTASRPAALILGTRF